MSMYKVDFFPNVFWPLNNIREIFFHNKMFTFLLFFKKCSGRIMFGKFLFGIFAFGIFFFGKNYIRENSSSGKR